MELPPLIISHKVGTLIKKELIFVANFSPHTNQSSHSLMSFRIYSTLAKGHKAKASILRVREASLHSRAFAAESGKIPRRDEMVNRLKKNEEYDILVIGGGSTGAGNTIK